MSKCRQHGEQCGVDDDDDDDDDHVARSGLGAVMQKAFCASSSLASKTKLEIVSPGLSGWLRKLVFLMCSWVLLVLMQRSREEPVWSEIRLLHNNLQDAASNKPFSSKLTKGLAAEEQVMQQLWKELQAQVATVQQVQKEFENLRQKNVDFQDHLTTVLKDLSSGIVDLRQRTLPGNGELEAKFEKTHFPVLWGAITDLEGRVGDISAGSDPFLAKDLQHEVDRLKEELNSANARLEEVGRQSKRERLQQNMDSMLAMKEELAGSTGLDSRRGQTMGGYNPGYPDEDQRIQIADTRASEDRPFDFNQPRRTFFAGQYRPASASSLAEQESISSQISHDDAHKDAKTALEKMNQLMKQNDKVAKAPTASPSAVSPDKKASTMFLNK